MSEGCAEVPLVEKLRSVAVKYRTVEPIQWDKDGRETGHRFIPVGYMMHEAADRVEQLEKQLKAMTEERDCWIANAKNLQVGYNELDAKHRAAQAKIDALMLEYCPEEMTPEQTQNWAAHQRPVKGV